MKRINLKGTARNFQQNFATAYSKIGQKHDWVCAGKHDGKSEEAHGTLCLRCKATLVGVWEESKERLRSHLLSQYRIPIEKAMAPHSSTIAWKIPWMEGPGRLWSMGSLRVRHDLSPFTFTFLFHALEKEMATHSSVLAWRIPGAEESGGLPSMGSHRVGHDWSDLAAIWYYEVGPVQGNWFKKIESS